MADFGRLWYSGIQNTQIFEAIEIVRLSLNHKKELACEF